MTYAACPRFGKSLLVARRRRWRRLWHACKSIADNNAPGTTRFRPSLSHDYSRGPPCWRPGSGRPSLSLVRVRVHSSRPLTRLPASHLSTAAGGGEGAACRAVGAQPGPWRRMTGIPMTCAAFEPAHKSRTLHCRHARAQRNKRLADAMIYACQVLFSCQWGNNTPSS